MTVSQIPLIIAPFSSIAALKSGRCVILSSKIHDKLYDYYDLMFIGLFRSR